MCVSEWVCVGVPIDEKLLIKSKPFKRHTHIYILCASNGRRLKYEWYLQIKCVVPKNHHTLSTHWNGYGCIVVDGKAVMVFLIFYYIHSFEKVCFERYCSFCVINDEKSSSFHQHMIFFLSQNYSLLYISRICEFTCQRYTDRYNFWKIREYIFRTNLGKINKFFQPKHKKLETKQIVGCIYKKIDQPKPRIDA